MTTTRTTYRTATMRTYLPRALSVLIAATVVSACTPGMLPNLPQGSQPVLPSQPNQPAQPTLVTEPVVTQLRANDNQKAAAADATTALAELDEFEQSGDAAEGTMSIQGFAVMQASDTTASPTPSPTASPTASPSDAASASPSPTASASPEPSAAPSATPSPAASTSPAPTASRTKNRTVTVNADGTTTVTQIRNRRLRNGATGSETLKRTFQTKAPRKPVSFEHTRTYTGPNGFSRMDSRIKTWNADGSWTVVTKMTMTLAGGKTRSLACTTTHNADGTWTQTGTITRFDGSTMTFDRSKTAAGRKAKVTDAKQKLELNATYDPAGNMASVTVTADGQAAGTVAAPAVDAGTEVEA